MSMPPPAGLLGRAPGEKRVHSEPTGVTDRTLLLNQHEVDAPDVLYWPSIVPVHGLAEVTDPLGEYYVYYSASHADSTVRLAYADDPLGPYTDYGPVFEDPEAGPQTETPEVVWNPDAGRLQMYYHGFIATNQTTALAVSGDGLAWEKRGPVIETPSHTAGNDHTGYLRVHRVGNYWLGYHLMGGGGSSGFGVSYSTDGTDWTTDPRRLSNATDIVDDPGLRISWHHTRLLQRDGRYWWIGSVAARDPWGPREDGYVSWAPLADERTLVGSPQPLVEPTTDWEGQRTYTPDLLIEDGTVYVIYATQSGSIHGGGEEASNGHIGGARIKWTESTPRRDGATGTGGGEA